MIGLRKQQKITLKCIIKKSGTFYNMSSFGHLNNFDLIKNYKAEIALYCNIFRDKKLKIHSRGVLCRMYRIEKLEQP